jgi:hypothetical protein
MKNLLVSFSGGETSAFMAKWLLNNYKNYGYKDILFVFANTGIENEETLEFVEKCDNKLGIKTHWIEAFVREESGKGTFYSITDFQNATRKTHWKYRDNTPFEQVIRKYGISNMAFPHCTRELKQVPIKKFANEYFGVNNYDTAIGIRADEYSRRSDVAKENKIIYPLQDFIKVTKPMINFFWKNQSFRLELKGYQGNCVSCWKKGDNKLFKLWHENNELFDFFEYLENKYGNPNGRVPKHTIEVVENENGEQEIKCITENVPKEELKIVFFRDNRNAKEMRELAKNWKEKDIKNDADFYNFQADLFGQESCDIFSDCHL